VAAEQRRALYLDASAIVKLVVREDETDALTRSLGDAPLVTSEISEVEVPRAAYLRTGSDESVRHADAVLARFHLVPLDEEVRRDAARARPADLRSLDAIHMASCLRLARHLEAAVAYDRRLADALRARRVTVLAPA
jgi:predicted nucleic acid-binding protein